MSDNLYLINMFGPSCGGKSTTAELLQSQIHGLYSVDFDIIKKQLSGYYWKNDRMTAINLTLGTLKVAVDLKLPLLFFMPPPRSAESYEDWLSVAKSNGYRIINVEMRAPDDILIERYKARLANWNAKHTPKTVEEYMQVLTEEYYRPDDTVLFDSSEMTTEQIAAAIRQLIAANKA